jgi:phosphohistidine swiveling domain-containing protein
MAEMVRSFGEVTIARQPLSHASIVAREYGIPVVPGISLATPRIRNG